MYVYKRGKFYTYEFQWKGNKICLSTSQENKQLAREIGEKHRLGLIEGKLDKDGNKIGEKPPAPTVKEFVEKQFEPWARNQFEKTSPNTWTGWYRNNLRAIVAYDPLASKPIDQITSADVARFGAFRLSAGLQVSSVNSSLRMVRRVLRVAVEWDIIAKCPKVQLLRGEAHRERVVTSLEQAKYLAAVPTLVYQFMVILFDTGLRPDEGYRLRWENVHWDSGDILNTFGKTAAARRKLPMTGPVKEVLQARFKAAGEPVEGFVFPAKTKEGHITDSTLKKPHKRAFRSIAEYAEKHDEKHVVPFVMYSARHTFLTRLGTNGCDVWTLAKIAGHSNIRMSQRYVHPDQKTVLRAMENMGALEEMSEAMDHARVSGSPQKSLHEKGEKEPDSVRLLKN